MQLTLIWREDGLRLPMAVWRPGPVYRMISSGVLGGNLGPREGCSPSRCQPFASAGDGEGAGLPCDAGAARRAGRAGLDPAAERGLGHLSSTVPDRTTRPRWPGRAALSRVISMAGKSSGLAAVHICTVAVPDGPTVKVPALTRRG